MKLNRIRFLEADMKRRNSVVIFFILPVFLLAILPVMAQADELTGTWLTFFGQDFSIMRFSRDGRLSVLDILNDLYTEYSGTYQADSGTILFDRSDGDRDEITYSFEDGKLILDWYGERICTRIDDIYFPEDPEASPFIGEDRLYQIAMAEDGGIQIFAYFGIEETLEIPSEIFGLPVTEIADDAICYRENLKHLILPDGIKKIGVHAFEENAVLEDVRLPDTLESIGTAAFMYAYNLKEVIIPESVRTIGDSAFWQCNRLRWVVLPDSLEEIGQDSFYGSPKAVFFVKPGSYAEQFCMENKYRYTTLENELWAQIYREDEIPEDAKPDFTDPALVGAWVTFRNDDIIFFRFSSDGSDLTVINSHGYYPETYTGPWEADGQTIYYDWAGYGEGEPLPYYFEAEKLHLTWDWFGEEMVCTRIDESLFPEDPEDSPYLGEDREYWFEQREDGTLQIIGYSGSDETLVIPGNVYGYPVTAISGTSFMSADGLKHVIVPEGITVIYAQAFANNHELESVQLPASLERIGYSAFEYCSSLKEIVIPEGVTIIEDDAFWGCENLTSVVLPASLEEIGGDGVFSYNLLDSIRFTVPKDSYAERYCRENGLNCFTADGERLTGGDLQIDDVYDVPVDVPADEEQFPSEETEDIPDELYEEPAEEEYAEPVNGDEDLYNEAMALYKDEKYFSARQAFLMSGYGDYEEMAEKCIQSWPSTGEIWHDRSQWLQDMELTIVVEQPEDTGMLIRIYKDNAPVSYLFLSGSDSVTVRLPGNGYYEIRDGVGYNWYGIKEAFGGDGSYETMTFDENGTKRVFLQSYYEYTLSINVSLIDHTGEDVYSESIDWQKFVEE